MTTRLFPTAVLLAVAGTALTVLPGVVDAAPRQDPQPRPGDMATRVAALEGELALIKGMVDTVAAENLQLRDEVDLLAGLALRQSKQAERLLKVYDEAETLGFTAGINFESRVKLLGGLRTYTADLAKGAEALGKGIPKVEEVDYDALNESAERAGSGRSKR